jgi:hypothetical protein
MKNTMNPWIKHLKEFRAKNPGLTLGQAMKKAKATYSRVSTTTKKKAPKKKATRKKKK